MKMPGRLGSLQARDVMSTEVLVLAENMPLLEATTALKTKRHSGAPVVDAQGQLVGTFSLRDLSGVKPKAAAKRASASESLSIEQIAKEPIVDSGIITAEVLKELERATVGVEKVADRMTRNAPSVTENASLIDVARLMCHFHTHRIPVTTAKGKLSGIITTMDVLAALVHTADELSE